jgi:sulfate permease, SulP family
LPFVDVTAARMIDQLAAVLARRGIRLVVAGEIGQVRDMVAAVAADGAPEYHRTVADAVAAATAAATAADPAAATDRAAATEPAAATDPATTDQEA